MNDVNADNFNETCKGYIVRALKIANENGLVLDKELVEKVMCGLRWSFDEMTMEDARIEYKKYRTGKIKFK